MTTRRQRCRLCGVASLVQAVAHRLKCPACRCVTILQNHNGGYLPSGDYGNGNLKPNTYVTNPGYAVHNGPYRPMNAGMVYQPYPPPAHGHKRAVLCGISYKDHEQSLSGSINDVLIMRKLLIERCGFPSSCIVLLTEEEDWNCIPTKQNIRTALRWLMQGCQPGDSLVFHYSGHGSQVKDREGDEIDGLDESLLPLDYQVEGRILDDELNATLVRPLPRGTTLHSIIDTCCSGTFLDLPNVCRINREGYYRWEDHSIPRAGYKGTSGGLAISISACDDHQSSGDTTAFTGEATGVLTYSFFQTLIHEPKVTYGRLFMAMHERIGLARNQVGLNSNASHLSQEPQLSSSHKFDIHSKPFTF